MNRLPCYPDAEQNKGPILAVLATLYTGPAELLEIGSGTGQHAVHFAAHLPHVTWQPSEVPEMLPAIAQWRAAHALPNLRPPIALDVADCDWPGDAYDGVYSCNTAHIMALDLVERMLRGVARALRPGGHFCLYGPFRYGSMHTAPSNARFDAHLRARDPRSGVRDVHHLDAVAREAGLELVADHAMPANNRTLVWIRRTA